MIVSDLLVSDTPGISPRWRVRNFTWSVASITRIVTDAMSTTTDHTTLVSLFHTQVQATQAMSDLQTAGIPAQSIRTLGGSAGQTSAPEQALTTLQGLNLPQKDLQVLADGLKSGGTVFVIQADDAIAKQAEAVFERHYANQIDERTTDAMPRAAVAGSGVASEGTMIPVVEESLVVGKQRVQRGGVRVFSRMVETPVEEQVTLHEEHATVQRNPVNRPISEAEINKLQNRSLEVQEMGEEAVVGKTARVVEEVSVGKETSERQQHITDTVRKTEIEVEQVAADTTSGNARVNPKR